MRPEDFRNKFVKLTRRVVFYSAVDNSFAYMNENDIVLITKVVRVHNEYFETELINTDGKLCYDKAFKVFFQNLELIP